MNNQVTKRVEYTYDIFDRRISKVVDSDGDGDTDKTEWYHYERDQLSFISDGTGELIECYFNGVNTDEVLAREYREPTSSGSVWTVPNWNLTDAKGTPVARATFSEVGSTAIIDY